MPPNRLDESSQDLTTRAYRSCLVGLPLVLIAFHWPWLVRGLPIHGSDTPLFFALHEEYRRWVLDGRFPLWTDAIFSGHPIGPESNLFLLHPLFLALLRWAGERATGVWLFLHGLLAGYGMSAYCREIGRSRAACAVAAYAFALGGYFTFWAIWPNVFAASAWFPFQLLCTEWIVREKRRPAAAALLAAASGFQWLSGHPQFAVLGAYFCGLYCLLRVVLPKEERRWRRAGLSLVWTGAALSLGLALAAVQVLPFLEVLGETERSGAVSLDFASRGSLPPWGSLLPLFPTLYGTESPSTGLKSWLSAAGGAGYWGTHVYAGALTGLLALFTLFHPQKENAVRVHRILLALCLLFALGKWGPVFPVLRYLPGFERARAPERALLPMLVSMCVLAAAAIDRLRNEGVSLLAGWNRIGRRVLLVVLGVWLAAGVALRAADGPITTTMLRAAEKAEMKRLDGEGLFDPDTRTERRTYARERVKQIRAQLREATNLLSPAPLANLGFLALSLWGVARWLRTAPTGRTRRGLALGLLLLADLSWFRMVYGADAAPPDRPRAPPAYQAMLDPTLRILSLLEPFETRGLSWDLQRRLLPPNMNAAWGMDSIDGSTSMQPVEYENAFVRPLRLKLLAGVERLRRVAHYEETLQILGVGYVIGRSEWGELPWPVVYNDGEVSVWRIPQPFPRQFVSSLPNLSDGKRKQSLVHPDIERENNSLVEELRESFTGSIKSMPRRDPDEAFFEVDLKSSGTFVRLVRHASGWRVRVDGKEVFIEKALGFFQGVHLTAGRHRVEFQYAPASAWKGTLVSLASIFLIGVLLALDFTRRRSRRVD